VVYRLERMASRCSHAELVQNPEDIDVLVRIGVPRRKIHLLGNGIDLARFDPETVPSARRAELRAELGIRDDEVLVGAVGRMVREKGYHELFAAAARLRRQAPAARIAVVGPADPDKPDAIDQGTIDRARADGVRFLGLRHDVEQLYTAMDIYVLASHREGFPRSAMEAAAMGLPIVATDIRGCRQVVEHGRTGLLVPAGRADALAEALAALVNDPGARVAMGRAGRAKAVREFDQQRQIDISLEVYEQLLRRPRVETTR
jgi:glycosyltransferase involved in cell wall biosynthesis